MVTLIFKLAFPFQHFKIYSILRDSLNNNLIKTNHIDLKTKVLKKANEAINSNLNALYISIKSSLL